MRKYTCKILELMDEGVADPAWLVHALLTYMSEHEAEDFYSMYFSEYDEEDEENEDE